MIDNGPRLLEARRGFSLSYLGKTLPSVFDPIEQAERVVRGAGLLGKTLYFCPSPVFGYGLESLLGRISADSAVLCVERDEMLMAASLDKFPKSLVDSRRCAFVRSDDPAAICAFARSRWGSRAFRRVEVVRLSGGWALAEREYEAIVKALSADIAVHWANAMTLVRLGRRYALNAVRNLALLPRAAHLGAKEYGTRPVLVLGAGPSMDALADRIERSAFRLPDERPFRLLCVDTALTALLARSILPDLVVALEAQHWNLRDFVGVSRAGIPLAMDLSAHPGTAAASGVTELFSTRWSQLRFLDRLEEASLLPPELPPLGSVGLTAIEVALHLSSGPVVVAGLDFAYLLDAYHARSTPSRDERLRRSTRLSGLIDPAPAFRRHVVVVAAKDGSLVRCDPVLRGYRDLFVREFAASERVVDAGTTGLELDVPRLDADAAIAFLAEAGGTEEAATETAPGRSGSRAGTEVDRTSATLAFIDAELERLGRIRIALSGADAVERAELDRLLDECDYLWAHFPECAGADGDRPPLEDLSFLKRVRAEIEPFAKAFTLARQELAPILPST